VAILALKKPVDITEQSSTPSGWFISKTTPSFTLNDLAQHVSAWNERTQPEQTVDLSRYGLVYHQVSLRPKEDLSVSDTKLLTQEMRVSSAKNLNELTAIMIDRGVDLRCKQQHVVVDENGDIVLVFSGNTTHSILTNHFELENRIVHEFKMGEGCTVASIVRAGVYVNSLEVNGSSPATFEDAEKALVLSINEGKDKNLRYDRDLFAKNDDKRNEWLDRCTEEFNQITCNKYKTKHARINELRHKLLAAVGEETLETIDGGDILLEILRKKHGSRYEDTADRKHKVFSVTDFDKVPRVFSTMSIDADKEYNTNRSDVSAKHIKNCILLYSKVLDPRNEIGSFLSVCKKFIKQMKEYEDGFILKHDTSPFHKNDEIIGVYNQSSKIEKFFQSIDKEKFRSVRQGNMIPLDVVTEMIAEFYKD
jgi:hypothetical protein